MVVKCLYGKDFPFKDGDVVYGSGFERAYNYRPTKYIAAKRGRLHIYGNRQIVNFTLLRDDGKELRTVRGNGMWFSDNETEALEAYNDMVFAVISEIDKEIEKLQDKKDDLYNNFIAIRGYD